MKNLFPHLKKIALVLSLFSVGTALQAQDFSVSLKEIYEEVIEKNAHKASQNCLSLAQQLQHPISQPSTIRPAFTQLVKDWKTVQATYILGDLNEDFLDTPSRIDIFRQGKEDWQSQINRALSSQSDAKTALFKHSSRSINALEFVLFQDEKLSDREHAFAQHIAQSICHHLSNIAQAYSQEKDNFLSQQDKALSYIVHSLSSSIFAARDWRIGDSRGLSRKYKGKPDIRRAEYFLSQLSTQALQSIFKTHQEMLGDHTQSRLYAILASHKEAKLASDIQANLQKIRTILDSLENEQALFDHADELYHISHQLYRQYYISMVAALPIVAKVLDADGD